MIKRTLLTAIAVAALAAAVPARAAWSLEAFGGWQNLRLTTESFENAIEGDEGTGIVGGQLLLDFGLIGVGAVVDKVVEGSVEPWSGAVLAGLVFPVAGLRLEALGELGQRAIDFEDIFGDGETFVGFRPGISFRLGSSPLVLGVSGIVRWPTRTADFDSPDYGIVGRVGFGSF
jgi:hypothetical protein